MPSIIQHPLEPRIGCWYHNNTQDVDFKIVAIDADGPIEIQYFDGNVEEVDRETWHLRNLEFVPPPKDWRGPFEIEQNDTDYGFDEVQHPQQWSPLEVLDIEKY